MPAIALDLSLVIQKYQKFTAPFGFDFGRFGARFWKFSQRAWLEFGDVPRRFGLDLKDLELDFEGFGRFGARTPNILSMALDGLVGLREAQRIHIRMTTSGQCV